ncbi:hypothetical protein ABZ801_17980 [Actinomadura sp. NPDC047616]|uniref:hypothetical protein n=1 Tax=Actinomadura sp. NPDC047616 TaxID=3155914 RepID=UPI0033F422C0
MTAEEIDATLPALRATGYAVDEEFWNGPGYGCCPPDPCVRAVPAKCGGDTGAPPPAVSRAADA